MKTKFILFIAMFLVGIAPNAFSQTTPVKDANVDLEIVASDLVNKCANIQEDDIVLVSGSVRDLELLENIAVNVRKKGAFPLLTISSDRMTRRMYTDVPEKYDSQTSKVNLGLVGIMTALISVSSGKSPDLLADIPPERFAKRAEAGKPVFDLYEKKLIKSVELGSGLYPTKAKADEYGISLDKLTEIFWAGVNVDYDKMLANGKKVESILTTGNELKITHKNGTSLSVKIIKQPILISDGIISSEDMKKGAAGAAVYLPAGEVMMPVVPGTANGKLVVEDYRFMGQTTKNLTLEFASGKLVSMKADSGLEHLKKYYDAQAKGIEEFSAVDFGINPNVVPPAGSKLQTWMPAGMITIGIGNNHWAGGNNNKPAGLNFFLPGCTATVDGKTIVENGKLK
ncbi:MAG: aminopeptidase [Mariniphaga sp.]|nr:aminopeptidase [Mariniphaga sp.]